MCQRSKTGTERMGKCSYIVVLHNNAAKGNVGSLRASIFLNIVMVVDGDGLISLTRQTFETF